METSMKINKFDINEKVMFSNNVAIVKDYIIHALERKVEYLIQVDENKPELVNEADLKKYNDAIPEYIKHIIRLFNNVHKCNTIFFNGNEIVCNYGFIDKFRIPTTIEDNIHLETYEDYSLEELGI